MNTNHTNKKEISECIVLSNQAFYKQFEFSSADFKLEIISATLEIEPTLNWVQLLPKFEIWTHVLGYSMHDNDILPAVKFSNQLHLYNDPNNKKPNFQLDKIIDKQVFGSNINLAAVSSFIVKIELKELQSINETYALQLKIIK